jgi:Tripartite tricarboxylate transporter TctB family
MRRGEFLFPGAIFLVTAVLLLLGGFYYHYARIVFMFPLAAGLGLCALCLNEIVAVLKGQPRTAPQIDDEPDVSMSWTALGWMLSLLIFLYGFGFVFGIAAYLLLCLRGNGFSWKIAVGAAAVSLLLTWGVFIKVLGVLLPIQPLWMS